MGCSASKEDDIMHPLEKPTSASHNKQRRSTIQIKLGGRVRTSLIDDNNKNVVFVGGPMSGKGEILEELIESFDVKLISAETLIQAALKRGHETDNRRGSLVDTVDTGTLMNKLRSDPLDFEAIVDLIRIELLKSPGAVHIIDLLPNSKLILRNKMLMTGAEEILKIFEQTFPIAFAMHLYIDKEGLARQLAKADHHLARPEGCTEPGAINDEIDCAKTKKRHEIFQGALAPVQNYFKSSDRLIEVDVSSNSHERIWYKIVDLFKKFNMAAQSNNNLVIVFVTDPSIVQPLVDCKVSVIKVADIVDEPFVEFDVLLSCLKLRLEELCVPSVCYIVDISGSALETCEQCEPNKSLCFEVLEQSKISEHINRYQEEILTSNCPNKSRSWDATSFVCYKSPNNMTLLYTDQIAKRSAEVISTTFCNLLKDQ